MNIRTGNYISQSTFRRQPRRKGPRLALGMLLVFISSVGLYTGLAIFGGVPTVHADSVANTEFTSPAEEIVWPAQGQAAIGSVEDGVLAVSSRDEETKPIASMAKIVTALAVLEKHPLKVGEQGQTLTMDSEDVSYYNSYIAKNGSVALVAEGESISQYQALQALLLPSSNNMAKSLARWAFGSQEAYVVYANAMVSDMGLAKTHIDDASGFSALTVSTPSEMIKLGQYALKNSVIAEIVAQPKATIPVAGVIFNTNRLLLEGAVGIKTGNTDEAGGCLLFAVNYAIDDTHSRIVIGVIMGAENPSTAQMSARALLQEAYKNFGKVVVMNADQVVGHYRTPWGGEANIISEENIYYYGWKPKATPPHLKIDAVTVPKRAGNTVGVAELNYGGQTTSTSLVLNSDITEPDYLWRIKNYASQIVDKKGLPV